VLECASEGCDDDGDWKLSEGVKIMLDISNSEDGSGVEETLTSTSIGEIPSSISLSIKSVVVINNVEVCILFIDESVII
jgi:hypothetical protein